MIPRLSHNAQMLRRDPRLRRLAFFVHSNVHRPISLGEAARAASLERTYFSSYFHRRVGVPFSVWLRQQRVEQASELLCAPGLTVREVAKALGYVDVGTFNRAFKRITKITPSEYRRRLTVAPSRVDVEEVSQPAVVSLAF